jgi:L-ascorbate metabolism protein UlaG (beta-lactamase superfamily)
MCRTRPSTETGSGYRQARRGPALQDGSMKLTKKGHACVRLQKDGRVLVIDPGGWSEEDAAVGADVVLVTHEHSDHFEEGRLRAALEANPAAELWTLASVAEQVSTAFPGRAHTVGHGDAFTVAGFDVQVHGELHAVIHPDIPRVTNVGYLVDGSVFHPGDALTVPNHPVDTLLLPVQAPWNKVSEVIDYVRELKPQRAIDVHDGMLSDRSRPLYDSQIGSLGGSEHLRLASGSGTDA